MQVFTDKQMDLAIGKLLRFGVIFRQSSYFSAVSSIYKTHLGPLRSTAISSRRVPSLQRVAGVLRGAVHLDANSVIQFGLLFLIATPVARVAFCVVGFARQRDRLYIVISSSVLVILIYSLIQGGR